jgi:DNA-binding NarL/FixJ family response regulator
MRNGLHDDSDGSYLLLISDAMFSETMTDVATNLKVPLATHKCAADAIAQSPMPFGAIIVDWDAGAGRALAAIRSIQKNFGSTPVLIIGQGNETDMLQQAWPLSVKGFVTKAKGFRAILDSAVALARMEMCQIKPAVVAGLPGPH